MTRSPRLGFFCSVLASLSLALTLGACAGTPGESVDSAGHAVERNEPAPSGIKIRLVAGNLSSGNLQSWDPGHGIRMLKGLSGDIAMLQEFNYGNNSDADYKEFVEAAFESGFYYSVESGVQIPNGIVSRYPIIDHGAWEDPQVGNRSFAWARIDIPGDKDLWAVSVHLLTSGMNKRQAEATALVQNIRRVVPESDYLTIGGDFNTGSRTENCLQTFGRITRTVGPWPVDSRNNGGTNRSRSKPYDWVIASSNLDQLEVPVQIGDFSFEHGFVLDSREFPDLAAVEPTERADSNASNMQHMAVVRDFALAAE